MCVIGVARTHACVCNVQHPHYAVHLGKMVWWRLINHSNFAQQDNFFGGFALNFGAFCRHLTFKSSPHIRTKHATYRHTNAQCMTDNNMVQCPWRVRIQWSIERTHIAMIIRSSSIRHFLGKWHRSHAKCQLWMPEAPSSIKSWELRTTNAYSHLTCVLIENGFWNSHLFVVNGSAV
jgi:hypothetical protein